MPYQVPKLAAAGGVALLAVFAGAAGRIVPLAHLPKPDTTLIVSAAWLAAHNKDPNVVVLHVDHADSAFRAGHIAGARFVNYMHYTMDVGGIGTELPPVDSLRALFEAVGVSDGSHVIVTGPPLMATRAFFTLDYLGLRHVSILDGGLGPWRAAGGAVTPGEPPSVKRGHITPHPRPEIVAGSDWMLAHLGKPGVSLIDTRTIEEYDGVGERRGLPSKGHLEGARRLEWQEAMRDPAEFAQ
ncbi:MAG TPA: rhodanese-like domain-containing protein, partial [Gemmatimonadaceae bacterium]|nr:rhodanese-like domain-containing protein [Gemmatimonadaceae bacterium]